MKKMITLTVALTMAIVVAACSNNTVEEERASHDEDIPFMHIHGLGYSSDGERLLIPVHNGLKIYGDGKWSNGSGETHDYMGFTMADNGFYSSGHPALGSDYQNPLGLIKSTDEGKTITVLALEGEVDFHGMSVSYRTHTLYAFNPEPNSKMEQVGLFYSKDEGETWEHSQMAGISSQITALAVHPTEDSIVALGTESGVYLSTDYGQTFAAIYEEQPISSIAFMDTGDLIIGTVKPELLKVNLETKQPIIIRVPVQKGGFIAYISGNPVNTQELALVTESKDVYLSTDDGVTWQQIAKQGQAINNE